MTADPDDMAPLWFLCLGCERKFSDDDVDCPRFGDYFACPTCGPLEFVASRPSAGSRRSIRRGGRNGVTIIARPTDIH